MQAMEPRLNFVTLVVADLDRARRFYLDGLGWTAALDVGGEVVMIHVGNKLVLSLWAESAARAEIGEVARGGTLPFTLAHNVASPAEVDKSLQELREMFAAEVLVDRAAALGDKVEVDFDIAINKVPIENGSSRQHPIVLGSKNFIPGFEEQLVGLKKEDA